MVVFIIGYLLSLLRDTYWLVIGLHELVGLTVLSRFPSWFLKANDQKTISLKYLSLFEGSKIISAVGNLLSFFFLYPQCMAGPKWLLLNIVGS